jgi:hypothetical protein
MSLVTIRAHYDGSSIQLDEPITLCPNSKLLVTVLEIESVDDSERSDWRRTSQVAMSRAYSDEEPEYGIEHLKWVNPNYAGS